MHTPNGPYFQPPSRPQFRTDVANRKFGFLVTQYRDSQRPHRISCRCCCGALVHTSIENLVDGIVTSCGCQPPSAAFRARQAELRRQRTREILFHQMQPTMAGR
jgi:hypothetical protein